MRVPHGRPYTAELTGKIDDVADVMRSENYLHVPVLDEEGVVVGVFNEAAIFDYFCSGEIIDAGRDKPVKDTGSARAKLRCDGVAEAQFKLGLMYDAGQNLPQDYAKAAKWYRMAADKGHATAQFNLGVLYAKGDGVPQDYAEAVNWYRLAAEQGNAYAQPSLGVMYGKGEGVPQDYAEAVKWSALAAEQGNAFAQRNLGAMYLGGRGVPQNYVFAHMWFNLAAAQGKENAQKGRDIATKLMTLDQIAEAQRMAREWMAKHQQ